MERLDALSIREYEHNGETKKQYTKLGVALPHRQGGGYTILLNAMPPSKDGQYVITLFPPKDDDRRGTNSGPSRERGDPGPDLNDDIGF